MQAVCDLFPEKATELPNCDAKNMAHLLTKESPGMDIIFINKARSDLTLDMSILENIKDGTVASTKYDGQKLKFLECHLPIMANSEPSFKSLSEDRWKVFDLLKDDNGNVDIFQRKKIRQPVLPDKSNALKCSYFDQAVKYWESLGDFSYSQHNKSTKINAAQHIHQEVISPSKDYASNILFGRENTSIL